MHDVFISYARAEREKAEPIKRLLESQGYKVFFDVQSIPAGSTFPDTIDTALKSAKAVLACWSSDAFKRDWVKRECRVGYALGKLIPVAVDVFDRFEVPTEFFDVDYADLRDFDGTANGEQWAKVQHRLDQLVPMTSRAESRADGEAAENVMISGLTKTLRCSIGIGYDSSVARARVFAAKEGIDLLDGKALVEAAARTILESFSSSEDLDPTLLSGAVASMLAGLGMDIDIAESLTVYVSEGGIELMSHTRTGALKDSFEWRVETAAGESRSAIRVRVIKVARTGSLLYSPETLLEFYIDEAQLEPLYVDFQKACPLPSDARWRGHSVADYAAFKLRELADGKALAFDPKLAAAAVIEGNLGFGAGEATIEVRGADVYYHFRYEDEDEDEEEGEAHSMLIWPRAPQASS